MGILNLTPDSFSDGGKYNEINASKSQIIKLIRSGANIIDIGGESTRPGSEDVNQKNEWNRVKETLKYLNKKKIFLLPAIIFTLCTHEVSKTAPTSQKYWLFTTCCPFDCERPSAYIFNMPWKFP